LKRLEEQAKRSQETMDNLPESLGGAVRELSDYEFMDPEAARKFQELMDLLKGQMMDNMLQGMRQSLQSMGPQEMAALREMLQALNQMIRELQGGGRPDFEGFMQQFGQLFGPEPPGSLEELLERLLPEAQALGVRLSVEHNSALRVDLGYLGTLHNALDLADKVDSPYLTVCLEMNNAWFERGLYDNIRDRIGRIGVVQIDDFKAGTTTTPSRVPLGDGIIPIERIVNAVLETGYDGYFDVEVLGPHVEEMGYEEAIRRCQAYLERLGPAR
ncbi:MAG: hypothetical protein IIC20_05660, partial [Chloroflexi bacterium]|nr:hypothetical protein [Chloroflexota bacterium]